MKHQFIKNDNGSKELLELDLKENLTYIHYSKGSKEKTACVLKSSQVSLENYLDTFFKENHVSEEIIKDVRKFFTNQNKNTGPQWREVIDFLLKSLSLNIVFGVIAAFAVYGGYKLGTYLDNRSNWYPLFTICGFLAGMGIGGLTIYSMVIKYFKPDIADKKTANSQPAPTQKIHQENAANIPTIHVTIDEVRQAIRKFSDQLPKGVYRTILVKDDNQIDFTPLISILGGLPDKNFYMSKETYDLFEEKDKLIPYEMDIVQKAVDQYVKEHKKFPVLPHDPLRRINYFELCQEHFLKSTPQTTFYLTDLEGMITHIKPKLRERL